MIGQIAPLVQSVLTSNIVATSVLAFVLGVVLRGAWSQVQDWRYQRKHSIDGTYLTNYEDIVGWDEDDEPIKQNQTAPTILVQQGESVHGKGDGIMLGQQRDWNLEGQIHDGGIVSGFFYTNDPHHSSRGNFLLVPTQDGDRFRGLWAGYDHVKDEIVSGEYHFNKVFDEYDLCTEASRAMLPSLIHIWCNQLGDMRRVESSLETAIDGEDGSFICVAMTDNADPRLRDRVFDFVRHRLPNQVSANNVDDSLPGPSPETLSSREAVGFCLGLVTAPDDIPDQVPGFTDAEPTLPKSVASATTIGFVGPVAVHENHQGQSLGTALFGEAIQRCKQHGVEAVCTSVRAPSSDDAEPGGQDPVTQLDSIMDHYGFVPEPDCDGRTANDRSDELYVYYSLPDDE